MRPLPHHHADPGPDQVAPQQRGMNPDTIEARFINASMMLKVAIRMPRQNRKKQRAPS
jgi:hypothetical protein